MKTMSVVGTRPQFIKAFVISKKLRQYHEEVLVHTGQHYDEELSELFFEELQIPEPDYNLGVGSDSHGRQTAKMITGIEELIIDEKPDILILYGDTNSTLAGAVSGSKLDPVIAHIEAGLRSYNRKMPEEINRVLTDHVSDLLFAPSHSAVDSLHDEGITEGVHLVGDVMYDSILWAREIAHEQSDIRENLGLSDDEYILATVHRAENTDDKGRLTEIIKGLVASSLPVVLPIHPRTKSRLKEYGLWEETTEKIEVIAPAGYLDFVCLLDSAQVVATDSGGVQKEAFYLDTPCLTMREETEWVELVDCGWNTLVPADSVAVQQGLSSIEKPDSKPSPYGDGNAADIIVDVITEWFR